MNYVELREAIENPEVGRVGLCNFIETLFKQKKIKPNQFSIRELAEATVLDRDGRCIGSAYVKSLGPQKSGRLPLLEAANVVDTSAFSNITGQIIYNRMLERYEDPEFLWPDLCETVQTTFLNGEKIPGIGRIGDAAGNDTVGEGMPYPTVGLSEEYIETVPLEKRGFVVPVTREIIIADRTGLLLDTAGEGAYWLGLNKEKRVLKLVTGQTNNYKRNGVATNTYLTSGAYVNKQTRPLTDWTSVEAALLLFDALTDPNTGELISIKPDTLLVPSALVMTAERIRTATEVEHVDNQPNPVTVRTFSGNPIAGRVSKVLSSSHVKEASGSATSWWYGQPKRAFAYMEAWKIEPETAAANSEAAFMQEVLQRFKVSEMGNCQVKEPRRMSMN